MKYHHYMPSQTLLVCYWRRIPMWHIQLYVSWKRSIWKKNISLGFAAVTKYSDKKQLKGEKVNFAHKSRLQSMITGKSRWQKLETASQNICSEEQRENKCLNPSSQLIQFKILCPGSVATHSRQVFPPLLS